MTPWPARDTFDVLVIGGKEIPLQVANLNVGILYIFSIASLAVYGTMLGGWASNNNYSLLGGLRASSQMISYEVSMGLSILGILMIIYPRLFAWGLGIGLILAGIAVLATVYSEGGRGRS